MFRQFHPRFLQPAWAGEGPDQFFMSGRHGRRGSFGGRWGDEPRTRRGDIKFILLGLLSERPHGYELMNRSPSRWLSPSSPALFIQRFRCWKKRLFDQWRSRWQACLYDYREWQTILKRSQPAIKKHLRLLWKTSLLNWSSCGVLLPSWMMLSPKLKLQFGAKPIKSAICLFR